MERVELIENLIKSLSSIRPKKVPENFDNGLKGAVIILKMLSNNECLSAGEIAKNLNVSSARIAVALNNLESKDYIEKQKDEFDARKTLVKITSQGQKELIERQEKMKEHLLNCLTNLTDDDLIMLINIINKI